MVVALARYPNLALKWCKGPTRISMQAYPYADVIPVLMRGHAKTIRENRGTRRRGIKVRLLGGKVGAVLDETLRLYPPAFPIGREALGADSVAGHPVRRGDVILIAPWLLHRHEKLWDAPNAFIPSRFLPGAPPPDRFAYLPFGVGPRVCIGAHFALVEATLALAKIVGRFRVELADTTPVLPIGVVTTQPDRSPPFRITRRSP